MAGPSDPAGSLAALPRLKKRSHSAALRDARDPDPDDWLPEPDASGLDNGDLELVVDDRDASDEVTDDDLPATEAARARRRDRDMEAERRALLRPGMAKVFRQVTEGAAKPPTRKQEMAKRAKRAKQ